MKKNSLLTFLKIIIIISMIPFGCVGRVFAPLFYLIILIFSLIATGQTGHKTHFLYEKKVYLLFYACLGFMLLQLIPLPFFLLKIISPTTAHSLSLYKEQVPAFHPISMVPFETIVFACKFLVFAFFFRVLINLKLDKKEMFSLCKVLVITAASQSLFGLLKYLSGNRFFFLFFYDLGKDNNMSRFLTGTLGNADHFAFFLEMILPLALALFFLKLEYFEGGKSLREKFLSAIEVNRSVGAYFIIAILLGAGIILSGSRSGIMTMVFSFMIFAQFSFYLKRSREVRKKLKLFFIIIATAAVLLGVQNTLSKFLSTKIENAGRFMRWPATVSMAGDFPLFGSGFGTYRYTFFLYDKAETGEWSTHAHSDYLEIAAEGGLIGSLLFLSLIGLLIFSIIKMWMNRKHPGIRMIGIGIITGLFAAALHSIFDFSLHIPSNMLTFMLIIGMGIKFATYKREFRE
jgi:O-antigen ligase